MFCGGERDVIKLSERQIQEVMRETGASRDYVKEVAMWIPGQYIKFGIVKGWSCFRCITCIGLARKVVWCIVCAVTKPPALSIEEAANQQARGTYVPPKPLRTGDMLAGADPSKIAQQIFPEMVDHRIWVRPLTK